MFGLEALDTDGTPLRLERHRLFETSFPLSPPACNHDRNVRVGGVYGGGRSNRPEASPGKRGGYTPVKSVRCELMGIPDEQVTQKGLSQAIPPAYTQWIGEQAISSLV